LRREAPDLIVTYNWGAIEWALANRWAPIAPHVHIEDGFGTEERSRQLARRVWMRRVALSGAHTRVVVPSHVLYEIAAQTWRLPLASLIHLPNGVDCRRFAPSARKTSGQIVVGTIAALRPEKNIRRLIEAFTIASTQVAGLRLLIVGDGPERASLESFAGQCAQGKSIEFRGATLTPEDALAEIDVFAISSDTEQMPLSVLEAMAAGLPIASVDVGDVAAMVVPENQPFIGAGREARGLSESLVALARDGAARERLGHANRQRAVATYDLNVMAARYADLFG